MHIFNRTLRNVKSHIGNGYNHLKNIAHTVNHGFNIAKQAYAFVEPVIRHGRKRSHSSPRNEGNRRI